MSSISVCTTYHDKRNLKRGPVHFSGNLHGITVVNFGWKDKFSGFLKTKLIPLKRYLQRQNTDLAMFVDGNDIIFTTPVEEILQTWRDKFGEKVVVGSEARVWPYKSLSSFLYNRAIEKSGSKSPPFISIDTGLILGNRLEIIEMLEKVINSVDKHRARMPNTPTDIIEDDVGLFALNLSDGTIDYEIDYNADIIVPMKSVLSHWYEIKDGRMDFKKTGSRPHIVHCNGSGSRSKNAMVDMTRQLLGWKKTKVKKA
jgi:hypothetical protein